MRKKIIISVICAVAAFVLFFPFVRTSLNDGGTRIYTALTYQLVCWHRYVKEMNPMTGNDVLTIKVDTDFYFFPLNFRDNIKDKVWNEESQKYIPEQQDLAKANDTAKAYDLPEEPPVSDYEDEEDYSAFFCDAVLSFDIEPKAFVVKADEATGKQGFYIKATTTLTSGSLSYWGSSTVLGAEIIIYDKNGTRLMEDPICITADFSKIERTAGDTITRMHHFMAGENSDDRFTPGTYDAEVSWFGQTQVFLDAVTIE